MSAVWALQFRADSITPVSSYRDVSLVKALGRGSQGSRGLRHSQLVPDLYVHSWVFDRVYKMWPSAGESRTENKINQTNEEFKDVDH